ncbi:MAG: mannosyltransferase family protein, partial [Cyanobacteriota bacterium SKYGB_h_bin112]|nr:mannosyltransferase family protein [Cyanobacteriota bacterium SKYGB_h_bin112]
MKQYLVPKFPSQAINQQTTELHQLTVGLGFVLGMWGLSRLVVLLAMLVVAPLLPEPIGGRVPSMMSWWTFAQWDSFWYYCIVYDGYEYVDDGHEYSVAFFPMYPLLIKGLIVLTGLTFEVVGTLLSNISFVGALIIAYRWLSTQYDHKVARWTVLLLTWCPLSFFVSVIYTEGLFLFFSTAALASFERNHHLQAGIWGALASATRFQGIMLVPAFVLAAWKDKRPITAYLGGL